MSGQLVLVATPIGNLGDISVRALEALRSASAIACEDTRHTRKLLNHHEIHGVQLLAVHEHNEASRAAMVVERVSAGETIAMVTDAGMPAISDPGERLVAAVAAAGLTVSVVPGPSAVVAAVAVSGLPSARFCFEGFLPRKGGERTSRLTALASETRTSVVYESPQRLHSTVSALVDACGSTRRVVLVRELTKLHEEIWRGTLEELAVRLIEPVKGECVLVLEGAPTLPVSNDSIASRLAELLAAGLSRRDAIEQVSAELGVAKNRVYDIASSK